MTDFSKILDKAKELEAQMKRSQEKIKDIRVEGLSGGSAVKVHVVLKLECKDRASYAHKCNIAVAICARLYKVFHVALLTITRLTVG